MRKLEDISIDEVRSIIEKSFSRNEVFSKLGVHTGPKNRKIFNHILKSYNINIQHFDRYYKIKQSKYNTIEKICPQCSKHFKCKDSVKRNKVTCSKKCSASFFSFKRMNEDIANKIRITLKSKYVKSDCIAAIRNCSYCQKLINYKKIFCNSSCASKHRWANPSYREKMASRMAESISKGEHVGWKSRNILSYPEKYFKYKLDDNKLEYITNYPISKKLLGESGASCYFLDFYFADLRVDLEIDGKQHEYPDRIASDNKRDNLLRNYGIRVFRIKWKNPSNDENKKIMDEQFNGFLKFLEDERRNVFGLQLR